MSIGSDVIRDVVLVVVLVLAVALLIALVVTRRRLLFARRREESADESAAPQAAVVVHSKKVDDHDARRRQIEVLSGRLGWRAPVWLETTAEDPGRGQTRKAVEDGASVVVAFGGDGTTRAVAESLAQTGVPMGLLPAGTGNLLARNLGVPPNRLESSLHIALTGRNRTIDIGHVELADTLDSPPRKETFLVMSGLGFDAEVMATTAPELKKKIGWVAYVVAGMSRLRGRRTPVTLRVDDGPAVQRRIRAVLVGNVGMLQGGIQLMPAALPDDGWLDVVVVSPRGVTGWVPVVGAVLTRRNHATVEHFRCKTVEIQADRPMFAQLDGDPAGKAQSLRARVDPLALVVRVPG
ncbi:diacylglycerol/lipid kinase family protein [Kineosporia babensis]|uniref:Diacylglycerol kinase family lipid kinase n=1 Tax=Kineosporia babensis TaxID=499548 RepID=A0A9X1T2F8_9ACTN|nr:diacylglycerol kinase family protein [Kineosporia babensis]MCD5314623.1 diacylglycerol kinase family lipid kinase [Kineosporia babensis]